MATENDSMAEGTGQDSADKEPIEKYDSKAGKYKDNIESVSTEDRLPTSQMPKAPDPSPMKLGPMSSGGR